MVKGKTMQEKVKQAIALEFDRMTSLESLLPLENLQNELLRKPKRIPVHRDDKLAIR